MNFLKTQTKKDSFSLVKAILFLILGIILIPNPGAIIKFIAFIIGGIFILLGTIKIITYLKHKQENPDNYTTLGFGIGFAVLGLVTIFCSAAIEFVIRVIMGGFLIYNGITKLILSFKLKSLNLNNWYITLIGAALMIACGLYTVIVANIIFMGIGFILVIYALIEIVQYIIVPKDKNPDIIK